MGLLDKLFGSKEPEYPDLPADSNASKLLEQNREALTKLAADVPKERLELVPSERGGYVFIGDPKGKFGLAWIEGDRVVNFKTLMEERGLKDATLERLITKLREAYDLSKDSQRYTAHLAERDIVVTDDSMLEENVRGLIDQINAALDKKAKEQGEQPQE